jgi:hypothetical protein
MVFPLPSHNKHGTRLIPLSALGIWIEYIYIRGRSCTIDKHNIYPLTQIQLSTLVWLLSLIPGFAITFPLP